MTTLNLWRVGSALALTAAVTNVVCAIAVYLSPDGMVAFVNSWMHGIDLAVLRSDKSWTVASLALGLFNAALAGFLAGALFAACWNLTAGRTHRGEGVAGKA
jgi:hypothetical protein